MLANGLYDILRNMRVLKNIIKITILLALLSAAALVTAYYIYRDELHSQIRLRVSSELSRMLQREVRIGSVGYVPFQSISLEHVAVSDKDDPSVDAASINNVTIELDLLSIIRDKQLRTTVRIEGLSYGETLCNATIRTLSGKATEYREVFDPFLLESATVIEAVVSAKGFMLRDIFGILQIDNTDINAGKIRFSYRNTRYFLDFNARQENVGVYDITLRSGALGFSCAVEKDEDRLVVDGLKGMFHTLRFDLKGEVRDYLSSGMYCALNGTLKADLSTFSSLPGKIGRFAGAHPMAGTIESNVYFERLSPDIAKCKASASLLASNLRVDKVVLTELATKLTLDEGRLSAPLLNGVFYGGTLSGNVKMDLVEDGMPYMLSAVLNDMDLGRLMRDLKDGQTDVWGDLDADFTLKGYADDQSSAEGSGSVTVSRADLGPMPLLTPLLGDLYSHLQNVMNLSGKIKITQAYADFEIKDRKLITGDLTFWGEDIYITSEGYVDFDGNLDFSFENQFRDPSSDEDREWPVELRNAIVSFGKKISRARLSGTVSDPKWDFEYINPIKNLFQRNIRNFLNTSE